LNGKEIPFGIDDVMDYLSQYGTVTLDKEKEAGWLSFKEYLSNDDGTLP
jgi:hypothetical protein